MSVRSRSNWILKVLVFKERGKAECPEKNLSEQRREPTTNSTHIWRRRRDLNPEASDLTTAQPLLALFLIFSLVSATGGENERSSFSTALDFYVLSESSPLSDESRFNLQSNLTSYKTEGKDSVQA